MKTYERLKQKAIFDNFRKVFVPDTPEERIRQKISELLVSKVGVPREFIYTEYPLAHIDSTTRKRADIIVSYRVDDDIYPLLVIEVKSNKVPLNDRVINQAMEYQEILGCQYIGIVNGEKIEDLNIYKVEESGELIKVKGIPTYDQLLNKLGLELLPPFPPQCRLSFEEVSSNEYLNELYYDLGIIGEDTPKNLWPIIAELHNLFEAEEVNSNLPYSYEKLTICEDIGSNILNFGNASGAIFSTVYRGFIIKAPNGNDEICRVAINSIGRTIDDPKYGNRKGTTVLNVAVDNFDKASDHVLELCLDKWLKPVSDYFELWHDGRMSSLKSKVVISYIAEKAPELVKDDKIYLGKIPKYTSIDWKTAHGFLSKVLLYASLRKEIRELKKNNLLGNIM